MIFQYFEKNNRIEYVYTDEYGFQKVSGELPEYCTHTWSFSPALYKKGIKIARFYCDGCDIEDFIPASLESDWRRIGQKMKTHLDVLKTAGISVKQNSIVELIPKDVLEEYVKIKNAVIRYIFSDFKEPPYAGFLEELSKFTNDLSKKKLKIDLSAIPAEDTTPYKALRSSLQHSEGRVIYEPLGAKLGRLRTAPGSFIIHNIKKSFRSCVKPQNDCFLELDYNSAEARVFLALSGVEQPEHDIHTWNSETIFGGIPRDKSKELFFAWLYDSSSEECLKYDESLTKYYKKGIILEKFWDGNRVKDYYGRVIEADQHTAVNAIMQSTSSGLFLRQMLKVNKLLENMKSHIAFSVHDSLVLDFSSEDSSRLSEIKGTFQNTDLGLFKTNISIGKDYGNMKKL